MTRVFSLIKVQNTNCDQVFGFQSPSWEERREAIREPIGIESHQGPFQMALGLRYMESFGDSDPCYLLLSSSPIF